MCYIIKKRGVTVRCWDEFVTQYNNAPALPSATLTKEEFPQPASMMLTTTGVSYAGGGTPDNFLGDKLTSFHTDENNRTAPGRGHLDWDEIFGALADINYKGRIVSEPFVMEGGEVGRDIHVYRNLVENPTEARIDEEAAYLLNFEKEMLKKYNM